LQINCAAPLVVDFVDEYVFATELDGEREVIASGVIKAPAGSDVMAYAWKVCEQKDPQQLKWGETGPRLMTEAVRRFSLEKYKKPYHYFSPLDYKEWRRVLEPGVLYEDSYAIHLWNEMWRAAGQDKNARYDRNCLYEQLKIKSL